LTNKTRFVIEF